MLGWLSSRSMELEEKERGVDNVEQALLEVRGWVDETIAKWEHVSVPSIPWGSNADEQEPPAEVEENPDNQITV